MRNEPPSSIGKGELAGVEFDFRDGVLLARIAGEVDASNADALGQALLARIPNTASGLILDMSAVTFLESTGIQLLFDLGSRLASRRQRFCTVVPPDSEILRALQMASFESQVTIYADAEEAIAS